MSEPLPPAAAAVPETMRAVLADCPPGATAPVYTYSDSARVRAPGAGELLVRVQLVSVCNSDAKMHAGAAFFWARPHGRCWANGRTGAVVPGHEWVAVVAAAGEGMGSWAVGDQVLCEQFMACVVGAGEKACWACREGHANKCERLRVFGQGLDGAMADFMVLPRGALLHKVDPPLPPAVAVLAELSFTPRMEVAMEVLMEVPMEVDVAESTADLRNHACVRGQVLCRKRCVPSEEGVRGVSPRHARAEPAWAWQERSRRRSSWARRAWTVSAFGAVASVHTRAFLSARSTGV